jgi:hypothetical protein
MPNADGDMQNVTPAASRQPGARARVAALALCILLLAVLTACAKATAAELVPDGPPLAMSAPPPRVITPADDVSAASAPPNPSPEPATTAAAPPSKTNAPPKPRSPGPADAKPEPPPAVAAQPATPPPTTSEPLEVRSIPSAAAAAEERKIRDVMNRAQTDLKRVMPQRLSAEGKSQYDQARRFYEQAEEALKEKNFVYATKLAENAATLAAELAGR